MAPRTKPFFSLFAGAVFSCAVGCGGAGAQVPKAAPTQSPAAKTSSGAGPLATAAVFVGCGYVYAGNAGRVPFSVFLGAKDAQQVEENEHLLILDGVLMEIQMATAAEIGSPTARGKELLLKHQRWELDYTSETNKWPPLPGGHPIDLGITGLDAIAWAYNVPTGRQVLGEQISQVMYVTAAIEDAVFVIAIPLRPGDDPTVPAERTWNIMSTIQRLEHGLNPMELSHQIKTSSEVWKDCRKGI